MTSPNEERATMIFEQRFRTAHEFLDHLLKATSDFKAPDYRSPWVYRGHADAGYELKPPAWRTDGSAKLSRLRKWLAPRVMAAIDSNDLWPQNMRDQRFKRSIQDVTEVVAVRQFCNLADELGIEIPNADSVPDVEQTIELSARGNTLEFAFSNSAPGAESIPAEHIPYAFAQHHGIPTRYLDWTRDPLVAAFFAVDDSCEAPTSRITDDICIWAIRREGWMKNFIRWITVPRAQHHYLHAQDGLFSLPLFAEYHFQTLGEWPSLDKLQLRLKENEKCYTLELHKFILPHSESQELRKALYGLRKSRAHLMRTLDNVAVVTRHIWDWYPKPLSSMGI